MSREEKRAVMEWEERVRVGDYLGIARQMRSHSTRRILLARSLMTINSIKLSCCTIRVCRNKSVCGSGRE
jgi:hypothetical protein